MKALKIIRTRVFKWNLPCMTLDITDWQHFKAELFFSAEIYSRNSRRKHSIKILLYVFDDKVFFLPSTIQTLKEELTCEKVNLNNEKFFSEESFSSVLFLKHVNYLESKWKLPRTMKDEKSSRHCQFSRRKCERKFWGKVKKNSAKRGEKQQKA